MSGELRTITVRITPEMHLDLKDTAHRERKSMNTLCVEAFDWLVKMHAEPKVEADDGE